MTARCKFCRQPEPSKAHIRKHVDYRKAYRWMQHFLKQLHAAHPESEAQ